MTHASSRVYTFPHIYIFMLRDDDVLHCDDRLFVIDKPPGMLSQADATGDADAVAQGKAWLREHEGARRDPFLGLVHRLDRPASGVLVMARTSSAARELSEQFRERLVDKRYLALVEGEMSGIGTCVGYIAKIGRDPQVVGPDHPQGKRAVLRWQALASTPERSLVSVQLETGRPHQIRLQLAAEGHAVVGDLRHGASTELDGRNLALHHARLRLEHPSDYRMVTFTAPVPSAWMAALAPAHRAALERVV